MLCPESYAACGHRWAESIRAFDSAIWTETVSRRFFWEVRPKSESSRGDAAGNWNPASPLPYAIVDETGDDNGVRFVDFDQDGHDDVIVSNAVETGIRLYDVDSGGFTRSLKTD